MSWRRISSSSSEYVFKTSWLRRIYSSHLQKTSWRRFQDILVKTNIFVLVIHLQDVSKMSSRYLQDMSSRHLERNNLSSYKTPCKISSRRLCEDETLLRWRRVKDVFKTCLGEVFKMSWRPTIICWAVSFSRCFLKCTPVLKKLPHIFFKLEPVQALLKHL